MPFVRHNPQTKDKHIPTAHADSIWSDPDRDAKLRTLYEQGYNRARIAQLMDIPYQRIADRCRVLGLDVAAPISAFNTRSVGDKPPVPVTLPRLKCLEEPMPKFR